MFKNILNYLLAKLGTANLGLRAAETILKNYTFERKIPFEEWTQRIVEQLEKISKDGEFTNNEAAEFIEYISTVTPKNMYLSISLKIAQTVLRNVDYSASIPYSGWANDMAKQFREIADDGKVTNVELANLVKFIRENR